MDEPAPIVGTTRFIADVAPNAPLFQLDLEKFSRDPAVVSACQADPLVEQGGAPVHTAIEIVDAIGHLRDNASRFTVPLLALHGTADEITPPWGSREFVDLVASRDKTLIAYDGLVHDLVHEPERERVLGDIVSWLDRRVAKGP